VPVKTGYKRQNVDTWAIASLQNLDETENAARSEIPALPYIIMPQGPPQVTVTRHMTAESLSTCPRRGACSDAGDIFYGICKHRKQVPPVWLTQALLQILQRPIKFPDAFLAILHPPYKAQI
jgi:hypothetical protein